MNFDQIYNTLIKAYLNLDVLIEARCECGGVPCAREAAMSLRLYQALKACTPYYEDIEEVLAEARWAERKATEEADKPALPF